MLSFGSHQALCAEDRGRNRLKGILNRAYELGPGGSCLTHLLELLGSFRVSFFGTEAGPSRGVKTFDGKSQFFSEKNVNFQFLPGLTTLDQSGREHRELDPRTWQRPLRRCFLATVLRREGRLGANVERASSGTCCARSAVVAEAHTGFGLCSSDRGERHGG